MEGELHGTVCKTDSFVTGIHWFPAVGKNPADIFAVSCTDGTFRIISKSGREEKKVKVSDAGAVICIKGNHDGTTLVTGAEDGTVKVYSRSGNLRATMCTNSFPVYAICWGPDNDQIVFTAGRELQIQSLQVGKKRLKWKAHQGVVMAVDWNSINNLIVSGGEDCMYKVWDSYGRQLYQSQPFENVITSVAWSPNGEIFAVGSFNMLRLCDRTGWSYCRDRPECGSLMQLAWTSDGTLLAGAGGSGAVVFGELLERSLEWNNVKVVLETKDKIRVQDVCNETMDELDFRDRVLEMSLGFGYLVLATSTQCYIYNVNNLNTPHIFDIGVPVNLIIQSASHFITIDNFKGVQVYTYEGRAKANPRHQGVLPEFLNRKSISLSSDTIAILDKSDCQTIRLFDVDTGRASSNTITHKLEIVELGISQYAKGTSRMVYFIDRNRDLYVTLVSQGRTPHKLHTQVDSAAWNDNSDLLMAIADSKVWSWYYPTAVYVDRDLLRMAADSRDGSEFGKIPEITNFFGPRAKVRRADGAILTTSVSPYPAMLYEFTSSAKWEEAVRLCRFVKSNTLWSALAAMALHGRHLDTAEIALAATGQVDKLHYILYIQSIPSEEGQNAELSLYRGDVTGAELTLLQATPPLVYRAIKMNIRLFRWERALALSLEKKTHVDTVLGYRQKYLERFGKKETDPKFKEYFAQVKIDWDVINNKKMLEKEQEAQRGGGVSMAVDGGDVMEAEEGKDDHK